MRTQVYSYVVIHSWEIAAGFIGVGIFFHQTCSFSPCCYTIPFSLQFLLSSFSLFFPFSHFSAPTQSSTSPHSLPFLVSSIFLCSFSLPTFFSLLYSSVSFLAPPHSQPCTTPPFQFLILLTLLLLLSSLLLIPSLLVTLTLLFLLLNPLLLLTHPATAPPRFHLLHSPP